jgi:hypothetical protein
MNAFVTCLAQYVVAHSLLVRHGLIIPGSMCNASCYAVLQDAKVTIIPPALQKLWLHVRSYFCGDDDHTARTQSNRPPDNDVRNCFRSVG